MDNCESMSEEHSNDNNDVNNFSGDDDEEDEDMYRLGFMKTSKTSTPCSTNCSPSLSISSVMSTDDRQRGVAASGVKQEKGLIKFSIDNILGGGSVVKTEPVEDGGCFKSKRKYELNSDDDDEAAFVKRSKIND